MSTPNYGLDAELKARQDAKYSKELEREIVGWIETVTGQTKGDASVADWLRDGQVLCSLANTIKPGAVKKVNTSALPFKQMENITFFTNMARQIGVPESTMFGTPDLYEEKNMGSVLDALYAFAGVVQVACPDFNGPKLGRPVDPVASDQKREKVMATQAGGFAGTLEQQSASTGKREVASLAPKSPPRDRGGSGYQTSSPPVTSIKAPPPDGADAAGLDADLKKKQEAKYDSALEKEVCTWIEALTGETQGDQSIADWLHNGQVLCALANAIKPGIVKKVNTSSLAFKQMENITFFINAARELGVPESSVFGTPDLYEEKNMGSVINCIYAYGGAVQVTVPDFCGPKLGVAMNVESQDKARSGRTATSQYEAMQRTMEASRPTDKGITHGAR